MNTTASPQSSSTHVNASGDPAGGEAHRTESRHGLRRAWRVWHALLIRYGPAIAMSTSLILVLACAIAGAFVAAALASIALAIGAAAFVMNRSARRMDAVTLAIQHNLAIQRDLVKLACRLDDITATRESASTPAQTSTPINDLATHEGLLSRGESKVDELTAATLDRSVFPRLLATMDNERDSASQAGGRTQARATLITDYPEQLVSCSALEMRNLVNEWNVALRNEDLITCRRIHATLIDTAPTQTLEPMKTLLEKLADQLEDKLRRAFARHVGKREFSEAIAVGEEIRRLFPHGAIAEEFERIKPYLVRRVV